MKTTVFNMYPEWKINRTQQKTLPSSKGVGCLPHAKKILWDLDWVLNKSTKLKFEKQYLPTDLNADSSEGRCYTVPAAASCHYVTSWAEPISQQTLKNSTI
jgi:hypothetical protein